MKNESFSYLLPKSGSRSLKRLFFANFVNGVCESNRVYNMQNKNAQPFSEVIS